MGLFNKERNLVSITDWSKYKKMLQVLNITDDQLLSIDPFWLPLYHYNYMDSEFDLEPWLLQCPQNMFFYWYKFELDNKGYIPNNMGVVPNWFESGKNCIDDFPDTDCEQKTNDYFVHDYIYYSTDKPGVRCKIALIVPNIMYYIRLLLLMHMEDHNMQHFKHIKVLLYYGDKPMLENGSLIPWLDSQANEAVLFIRNNKGINTAKANADDGVSDRVYNVRFRHIEALKEVNNVEDVYRLIYNGEEVK